MKTLLFVLVIVTVIAQLFVQAANGVEIESADSNTKPGPGSSDLPNPTPTTAVSPISLTIPEYFDAIYFGASRTTSGFLSDIRVTFAVGTERVYAQCVHMNLQEGLPYTIVWYRDGEVWVQQAERWHQGDQALPGLLCLESPATAGGLKAGKYRLELRVTGKVTQSAVFTVSSSS